MKPLHSFIFDFIKLVNWLLQLHSPNWFNSFLWYPSLTHLVAHSMAISNKCDKMLTVEIHQFIFELLIQENLTATAQCLQAFGTRLRLLFFEALWSRQWAACKSWSSEWDHCSESSSGGSCDTSCVTFSSWGELKMNLNKSAAFCGFSHINTPKRRPQPWVHKLNQVSSLCSDRSAERKSRVGAQRAQKDHWIWLEIWKKKLVKVVKLS